MAVSREGPAEIHVPYLIMDIKERVLGDSNELKQKKKKPDSIFDMYIYIYCLFSPELR